MSRIVLLALAILGFSHHALAYPELRFHEAFYNFNESSRSRLNSTIKNYEYVLVAGFMGRATPRYFRDSEKELLDSGIPQSQIHKLKPRTRNDVIQNLPSLYQELLAIHSLNQRPLVIVAHSKGAIEILAVALSQPAVVPMIHRMYLLQAALKGSGVADYIKGLGPESDSMPTKSRVPFWLGSKIIRLLKPILDDGVTFLTHKQSARLWNTLIEKFGWPSKELSSKIYYIPTKQHHTHMANHLRITGKYLQLNFGDNDGMLAIKDQYFEEFGKILGIVYADHTDLVLPRPFSNAPPETRRALTNAILQTL